MDEIPTATWEPSEIATWKGLKFRPKDTVPPAPLTGPQEWIFVIGKVSGQFQNSANLTDQNQDQNG